MKPSWQANPIYAAIHGLNPPVEWLFKDFLPQGSLMALGGLAGAGKSFLCYTLGMSLATAFPVLGFTFPRGPLRVLYFDDENSETDYAEYQRLIWHGFGKPAALESTLCTNFWAVHFELGMPDWVDVAAAHVRARQPHLIVIDTTTPACNIKDENANGEASEAVKGLRRLMHLPEGHVAACIALKHAKADHKAHHEDTDSFTMRGAKAWFGQVDSVVYHVRDRGRPREGKWAPTTLRGEKARAFGLHQGEEIHMDPHRTLNGGVLLTRVG